MFTRAHAYISSKELIPPGSRVLVAVSGGPDSSALLHVLASLAGPLSFSVHAGHFNHGFRGAEAEADEAASAALAASLGVPFASEHGDVPAIARRLHLSKQEAARRERWKFLEQTAERVGAERIATGHTRDDQVETVLLNILRGTGTEGLRGLTPRAGNRIRPLLEVSREETQAYCRRHEIEYRTDSSNASLTYRRNRVRTELLPELETYYNPSVRDALLRLSSIASDEVDYLQDEAERALEAVSLNVLPEAVVLDTRRVAKLHTAIARSVVRLAVKRVRGNLDGIEFATVERVLGRLDTADDERWTETLPGGVRVQVGAGALTVREVRAPSCAVAGEWPLKVPGRTDAHGLGVAVCARLIQPCAEAIPTGDARAGHLSADALRFPLVVRNRRPGDRIRPLGMAGSRKIQDILVDRKTAREERDRIPVIADAEGPLWVVGHAISERARIGPATHAVLALNVEEL